MKRNWKKLLFVAILLQTIAVAQAQEPSLDKLADQVDTLNTKINWIIGVASFLGLLTLGGLVTLFTRLKKRVDTLSKEYVEDNLQSLIQTKLEQYPFIEEYERVQKIKQEKRILIVGTAAKDMRMIEALEKQGFTNTVSHSIEHYQTIDTNYHDLRFFNNLAQDMTQEQMDKIVRKFSNQVHFFYLTHPDAPRWKSGIENFGKIGFASSPERIEPNLIRLFS